jgi:hypothetical protein
MFVQSFWKYRHSFYYTGLVASALLFQLGCTDTAKKPEQRAVNPKVTKENFAKVKQDILLSAHVPRHFWSFLFVGYSDVQVTGRRASRLVALVNAV